MLLAIAANPLTLTIANNMPIPTACRFAISSTPDSFRDAQSETIPNSRFNGDQWYHPNQNRLGNFAARGRYFLHEDITERDLEVFQGISGEKSVFIGDYYICTYHSFLSSLCHKSLLHYVLLEIHPVPNQTTGPSCLVTTLCYCTFFSYFLTLWFCLITTPSVIS